jgi:hypothetical protein
VSSVDFRKAESLLRWCRATLVLVGASGCVEYVPGSDLPIVEGPVAVGSSRDDGLLEPSECGRYCSAAYGATGTCHVATLAIEPPSPAPARVSGIAPGSSVIVCETDSSGHWESHSLSPFMQFGRRPLPLSETSDRVSGARTAAEYFEGAAQHERAAVRAFQQLTLDLEQLGAPAVLVRAARRAVRDEARHARWTLALARAS